MSQPSSSFSFTDACITALSTSGEGYERSDNSTKAVPGLSVRVTPTGKKTFSLLYRNSEGVRRRIKLGDFPTLSVKQAQTKARLMAAESQSNGRDHLAEKEAKRQARARAKVSTLSGFLDGKYRVYAQENLKRPEEAISRVNACFPDWLDQPMSAITDLKVQRWITTTRGRKTETTIGADLNRLSGVLSVAVAMGYLNNHPLQAQERKRSGIKLPSCVSADDRVRYLSPEERARLMNALIERDRHIITGRESANARRRRREKSELPTITGYGDYLHPLIITALNTGLRRGELLQLTWDNVHLDRRQVTVMSGTSKSGRQRIIPLNADVMNALRRWKRQSDSELVFSKNGKRILNPRRAWNNLLKSAQIEDFRFHDCRHDFASQLVMRGIDLLTVSKLMGHSTTEMTMKYAHLSPDHLVKAVQVLE